jgi:uncharacterized protein
MNLFNTKTYILKKSKNIRGFILMFFILVLCSINAMAQTKAKTVKEPDPRKASISVIARVDNDSVVLRWAPSTPGGWIIANKVGYNVERIMIEKDKPLNTIDYVKLTAIPVKPLSLDRWKGIATKENMFASIAAQALYGKSFNPRPTDAKNASVLKNAADELTNRYSFSLYVADNDAKTANGLGLRWVDKNIQKEKQYVYRVYVAEKTSEYTFDTGYVVVNIKPYQKYPSPSNFRFESGDGNIKLFWEEMEPFYFSGFYLYRSENDGKNYSKLNKMPIIVATPEKASKEATPNYNDTLTINYKKYKYKVIGVTPFGELSDAVEITAFSKDLTPPPAPLIKKPKQVSDKGIKISWELKNPPSDFKGFIISRSNNSLNSFEIITKNLLPINVKEFTDNLTNDYEAYYAVGAVDTAGNMSFSLPVLASRIDTTPPAPPKGLHGKINKQGIVTLSWNLGREPNIIGYRVLRANDPTHEFIQLTGQIHHDTVFVDTISINTLTRHVYYRIAAVNRRHQHSELSPILSLNRPDIIPPAEAVFDDIFVTDTSVYLHWANSPSEDIAKQILVRKIQGDKKWGIIDSLKPKVSSYIDKKVRKTIIYEYSIITLDSSGLSSKPAMSVQARPYDTGKRKPVEHFTAEYIKLNNTVALKWQYTPLQTSEKYWYLIYKAGSDGVFKELKAVKSQESSHIDTQITDGSFQYGIVVMTSNGGESKMTTAALSVVRANNK